MLHAGAERYAKYCSDTGITNTTYVKLASTFFSKKSEFWNEPWDSPPANGDGHVRNATTESKAAFDRVGADLARQESILELEDRRS